MIIRVKDYLVQITDTEGCDKEACAKIAQDAIAKMEDAELGRNINTNISFSIQRLKEAFDKNDSASVAREIRFFNRDLDADASDAHKNYPKNFRKEVLEKIVDRYDAAIKLIRKNTQWDTFDIEEKLYRIKENWGLLPDSFKGYIKESGKAAEEADFTNKEDATTFVRKVADVIKKAGGSLEMAHVMDNNTGEILFNALEETEVEDSKKVCDVPYFDPTDNPVIESEYSVERLKKEIAHPEKGDILIDDFTGIVEEIDDFIQKGSQALIDAGWSKIDARHAIAQKYYPLVKELRKAQQLDLARELRKKIRELEKAWDLVR